MGVLSWHITDGRAGSVELTGLNAALALRYDDDEKCSPWDHVLYIDERADDDGRHALTEIAATENEFCHANARASRSHAELRSRDNPIRDTL